MQLKHLRLDLANSMVWEQILQKQGKDTLKSPQYLLQDLSPMRAE